MNTAEIVNAYLAKHRMRPPDLARQMNEALKGSPFPDPGITRQAVHYWTTGETAHPDPGRLFWIAEYAEDENLRQLAKDLLASVKENNGGS